MADRKILTHLDFLKASEIQNVLVHKLAAAPGSPVEGQLYYDTVTHKLYVHNGTVFVACLQAAGTGLELSGEALRIGSAAAGNGLSGGAGSQLDVNAGDETITVAANDIRVNVGGSAVGPIATKAYADSVAQGLDVKNSCRLATAAALPTNTVSGKELKGTVNELLTVDGKAVVLADRILVKNEASAIKNGIYEVIAIGSGAEPWKLKRTADADSESPPYDLTGGAFTFVEEGAANADTGWVLSSPTGNVVVGVTANSWSQFSGGGEIEGGAGLTKTGNVLDVVSPALSGITVEPNLIKVDPAVVALLAGTNPFTTLQTIDLAAHGAALRLKKSGGTILTLETSAVSAIIAAASSVVLGAASGTATVSATGNVILEPGAGAVVRAATHKITEVVDPTEAQDAATKNYVDTSAGKKFSQNIGNGALTAIEVTHSLGTRDVIVEVYRNSTPWDTVEPTVERTSTSIVTLRFNTAPTTEQFRVVVKS